MQYLTYEEYMEIGGTLDLTAFNRNIDRACGFIDLHTQSRLQSVLGVSRRAKACVRDLVEYLANNLSSEKAVTSKSQSAGGVSESELNSYLNSLPRINGKNTVFYNQGKSFIDAAKKHDIDLVYLVAHAMWETGYGKSTLAKGQTITSYKGKPLDNPVTVYNFFGIGAIDKSANVSGAEASYSNGWTSIEKTIDGSAKWLKEKYIENDTYDQNTIYKMRFYYDDINHQYATDVNWANGISGIMYKLISMYDTASNLSFEVPNYK